MVLAEDLCFDMAMNEAQDAGPGNDRKRLPNPELKAMCPSIGPRKRKPRDEVPLAA